MYLIMGKYKNGATEEIDSADTSEDAADLLVEYRLAFGSDYTIWIKNPS